MGWVMLALIAATAAALLVVLRVPRLLWSLVGVGADAGRGGLCVAGAADAGRPAGCGADDQAAGRSRPTRRCATRCSGGSAANRCISGFRTSRSAGGKTEFAARVVTGGRRLRAEESRAVDRTGQRHRAARPRPGLARVAVRVSAGDARRARASRAAVLPRLGLCPRRATGAQARPLLGARAAR